MLGAPPHPSRLAALLSADASGYSARMAADESGTARTMEAHRATIEAVVLRHAGRVVDSVGDNLLAAFEGAVDAVACAIAIQQELRIRNEALEPSRRLPFRIGVHGGETLVDGDRVSGNSVNIAARLEGLAEPGGVCLSQFVREQIEGRLPVDLESLGPRRLKNIPKPVVAYRVANISARPDSDREGELHAAVPGFEHRPAVAILPFEASADRDLTPFVDGIAQDLVARLSRFRHFPIIDWLSSSTYRGEDDLERIGRELGVRYAVTGSARRTGKGLHLHARLVDVSSGGVIWSERFDRDAEAVVEISDDVTESIAAALEPSLARSEQARVQRATPEQLDAWECVMRGLSHLATPTREHLDAAADLARRALALSPTLSSAWTLLAVRSVLGILYQELPSPAAALAEALEASEKALELDDLDAMAHAAHGFALYATGQRWRARHAFERAIELNPSLAVGHDGLGIALLSSGRAHAAIGRLRQAIRLSPRDPKLHLFLCHLAQAQLVAEQYEEGARSAERSLALRPDPEAWRVLAACLGYLGRADAARSALDQMLKLQPHFELDALAAFTSKQLVDLYVAGWRMAGWTG